MRKRNLTGAACLASLALVATACGGSDDEASTTTDGKARLVYWQHSYEARDKVTKELADEFMQENDQVSVETQFIPYDQYFDKLVTALQAGEGPDVFQVPQSMAEQLVDSGAIAAVPESIMTTEEIESAYVPATIDKWRSDDKFYALPTDVQTVLLFANKTLLEKCGGDPENLPTTWDELAEQARACTVRNANGDIAQAGLDTIYKWALYSQSIYSSVEEPVFEPDKCTNHLDDPAVVDAYARATDFSAGADAPDAPNFMPSQSAFTAGKAVFYINHPVTMGTLADYPDVDYVVGQAPTESGDPKSIVFSWAYVVNVNSDNQDEAWSMVEQLADEDAQRVWFNETGSLPAMPSVLAEKGLAKTPAQQIALDSLEGSRYVESFPAAADDVTDKAWDKVVTGGTDPAEAMAAAQEEVDTLIADTLDCTP